MPDFDAVEYCWPGHRARLGAAAYSAAAVYTQQSAAAQAYASAVAVPPGGVHPAQASLIAVLSSVPTVGPPPH